jgi:gliding motility-associated-like protein
MVSGTGIYEYSLNGTDWQTENTFDRVASGIYTVYVRDRNECGLVTKEIFVLDYPKFFTPNGDGANDVWHIPYLAKRPSVVVNIFDRYGKLIYSFKGNSSVGWDGTYKGRPLPSTDYWFTITLESGTTVRGHFSLIR